MYSPTYTGCNKKNWTILKCLENNKFIKPSQRFMLVQVLQRLQVNLTLKTNRKFNHEKKGEQFVEASFYRACANMNEKFKIKFELMG